MTAEVTLSLTNMNVDKICRTCLSEGQLQSIFAELNTVKLADMLAACTRVQISDDDELPKQICVGCMIRLNQAYAFRQQCEKSNATLELYVKQKFKAEADERFDTKPVEIAVTKRDEKSETSENVSDNELTKINFKDECKMFSKTVPASHLTSHNRINSKRKRRATRERSVRSGNGDKNKKTTCTVCLKNITTVHFATHMRIHTNEKPYGCEHCGKSFNWKDSFQRHVLRHKSQSNRCELCAKTFVGVNELAYHMNARHPIDDSTGRDETGDGRRPFCEICKKNFSSKGALKVHTLTHGPKTFFCGECDKKFSTATLLKLHRRVHTGEKPYSCEFCDRRFSHSNAYRVHSRVHTGERPYVCKVCGVTFTQGAHLRRHLVTHGGEKLFLCNVCGASFNLNLKLKVHMRLHTGETPYLCSICGKGYRKSSSLLKHRKSKAHAEV